MKHLFITIGTIVITACGSVNHGAVEVSSKLHALYAESSIGELKFGLDGDKIYLVEGTKAFSWAHEAPKLAGNKVKFKEADIGDVQTGYFCNGPYDSVCDASIYKNRPATITMKKKTGSSTADQNSLQIITANTQNLGGFQVSAPINGKAKGSCSVSTNKGNKKIAITVEKKDQNGVALLEVKTPIYQYDGKGQEIKFVEMKTLMKVSANGSTQNVGGSTTQKSSEVSGLLRLFN